MIRPALTALTLLALLSCSGGGSGGGEARPSQPPPGQAGEYVYPAGGSRGYREAVDRQLRAHPPSANKRALIRRHLELATDMYDQCIAGSKVRIFQPNALADGDFLQVRLEALPGVPVTDLDQSRDLALGRISYHLTAGPYVYSPDQAYVDFAARRIGGGVLGGGFVQEEIAILESTFLPWVAELQERRSQGTSFAPDIALDRLDQRPVVLGLRRFLEVAHPDEVYGRLLDTVHPFDPARYLQALPAPMDIYLTAMAARNFGGARHPYTQEDITAMTLTAARAFYDTLAAQDRDGKPLALHTGNWGAGAFRNSRRTVWAIQRAAIEAAYLRFARTAGRTPPLDFYYDAFDPQGVVDANEAHNGFAVRVGAGATLEECARAIFRLTQSDPAWQVAGAGGRTFLYNAADLQRITDRHPGVSLDPRLASFLTDPGFSYRSPDYDFGIERRFGVLWLHPHTPLAGHETDRAFLQTLNRRYPREIAAFHRQWAGTIRPDPFVLDRETRLADNDIAAMMAFAAGDPRRLELMRKVLFHCLTR